VKRMPAASPAYGVEGEAWREWARLSEGCYVLRSNVTDWSPEDLGGLHPLTEAEAAFHIHKSDLGIRPCGIRKKIECRPILVCFWPTCSGRLWPRVARGGLGDEPRQVFEALSEIAMVDVVLPTRSGRVIASGASASPPSISKSCSSGSD